MARTIIITLFIPLFCFFLPHQVMSQPEHMHTFCNPIENFTQTSPYESNRDLLLISLSQASSLVPYFNIALGLEPDTVHGMFLCRGDINTTSCSECIQTATLEIASNCTLNKRAVIYYKECMVRYSNVSFLTELEITPNIVLYSITNAPNSDGFNQTLTEKFSELTLNVSSSSLVPYFVEDQEVVTHSEGSYELKSMVQCSPDLDMINCTACLRIAFFRVSTCCGSPSSSRIFTPKCLLSYKTFVLSSPPPTPGPVSPPPLSSRSPPPESSPSPPTLEAQPPPPPLVFTRQPNGPSPSGSFSCNVISKIYGRIIVAVMVLVFALGDQIL